MKLWIYGLGVCLLASPELPAQFGLPVTNSPALLAWELEHPDVFGSSRPPAARPGAESSVVSVSELQQRMGKRAQQLFKKGLHEYSRRNYERSVVLLKDAIELEPRCSLLENNLGVSYWALGEHKSAEEAFSKAVGFDPGAAISLSNLAALSFDMNEYAEAESWARQALRLRPQNAGSRFVLALALVAQDHWTVEARGYLEETRGQFAAAQVILAHWPGTERHAGVSVRGAGPGR